MHPQSVVNYILRNLEMRTITSAQAVESEGFDPNIKPIPCSSFDDLIINYHNQLHMTVGLEDTAAVMVAVALSIKLGGNSLWVYIVGPPSSGKSTLAACLEGAYPWTFSVSKLTGVFSGYVKADGKDCSLVTKFQDKTVIIKDFTTILSGPQQQRDTIFGELRDLYDGSASSTYKTGVINNYKNVRFTILSCVTDMIRTYNQTGLGERFLVVEIDSQWDADGTFSRHATGDEPHIQRALTNMLHNVGSTDVAATGELQSQKCHTWGFLDHLAAGLDQHPTRLTTISHNIRDNAEYRSYLIALAKWVGFARSNVERDREKHILFRSRPELGLRLASQLMKLSISLCLVFQIEQPDERVKRIIRKVALDTAISFPLEIMLAITRVKTAQGLTRDQLAKQLDISPSSISNHLANMKVLGIVEIWKPATAGIVGRPTEFYRLSPDVDMLAKTLGFS